MNERTCSVGGCERAPIARGLCNMHWQRWWRHGDPNHVPPRPTAEEKFWSRVAISPDPDGCWLWTGTKATHGYGAFHPASSREPRVLTHRFAYELLVGPIPEGLTIDHLCRVKNCVNPKHLEPVTQSENSRRANPKQTHCKRGHPYEETGTVRANGQVYCRKCRAQLRKPQGRKGTPEELEPVA